MTMQEFKATYEGNLIVSPLLTCLPDCFTDLCSGWTQETFRQIIMSMTRRGAAPIKLWFDSAEEMAILSNKRAALEHLFKLMDTKGLGRIDTLELCATLLITIQGPWETILNTILLIFGFGNEREFSRNEFHFFLDCLFRGFCKLLIPTPRAVADAPPLPALSLHDRERKKPHPLNGGRRVLSLDIDKLVAQVFPNNIEIIEW
jgi:hypothetical protein